MAAALAIVHWSVGTVVVFQSSACDCILLNGHRSKSEYGSRQLGHVRLVGSGSRSTGFAPFRLVESGSGSFGFGSGQLTSGSRVDRIQRIQMYLCAYMAGKTRFCTHCGTHTWIEIELADFLYNWRGEYDFLLLRQHGNSQGSKKCPVDSEGSDGSEIWIPILTNRTCP